MLQGFVMGEAMGGDPKASSSVGEKERETDEVMQDKQGLVGDELKEKERGRGDAKGKMRGGQCMMKEIKILAFQIKSEGLRD